MKFKAGESGNPSGRPKGTSNEATKNLRQTISNFLESNFEQVQADFKELKPKDRARLYCDLLQYGLPRLQAVQLTGPFENMTDDELDYLLKNLKEATNGQKAEN